MTFDQGWFTEANEVSGTGFSLKVTEMLHEELSPYQKITVYQTSHFGRLLTLDDMTMVSDRDNFIYHEVLSHTALFAHPEPKEVVIVGGGDCGMLKEVLKHQSVTQAIQIEIDERVTRVAEQYFPELCDANHDPRAQLLFEDGIAWMKNAPSDSLDVIIIDSTDPVGPAEGLFGEAFYTECRRVLRKQGILIQQSESPLLHLPLLVSMHQAMRTAGFKSTATLNFPQCIYPSGWWSATLAGEFDVTRFRENASRDKPFATRYYNAELHKASFVLPNFMREALPNVV